MNPSNSNARECISVNSHVHSGQLRGTRQGVPLQSDTPDRQLNEVLSGEGQPDPTVVCPPRLRDTTGPPAHQPTRQEDAEAVSVSRQQSALPGGVRSTPDYHPQTVNECQPHWERRNKSPECSGSEREPIRAHTLPPPQLAID
ncbi:hypothetical protein E2C01_095094 [Portunus trituberculatus]|uniref:Uncharacterized protein n=1 Tax=Portunus trituberculatus TaxID=210409 RepID=A0A5B7JZC2_PORTR|nr:hypothetical protein [Portunus trituberculatus]